MSKDEGGVGPHGFGKLTPFDQFVREEVERRRKDRETNPHVQAEHEKLQAELAEIREKKRRRRARSPYDFS